MTKRKLFIETAGWYGTIAILLAYVLVSFKVLTPSGLPYQLLNLTGAAGIVLVSVAKGVRQSAVLNFVWLVIALVAIIQIVAR